MKISYVKVLKSDYLSVLALIVPIVATLLFIDVKYFGILKYFLSKGKDFTPGDAGIFFVIAIIAAVVFIPLLLWRMNQMQDHFENGIEVVGKIVYLKLWKDRGKIRYTYEVDGKQYISGQGVHRNRLINSLSQG